METATEKKSMATAAANGGWRHLLLPAAAVFVAFVASIVAIAQPWALVPMGLFAYFVTAFLKPEWGCCVFLVAMPLFNLGFKADNPERIVNEFTHVAVVPAALCALAFCARRIALRDSAPAKQSVYFENLILLFFWGIMAAGLVWSNDLAHGVNILTMLTAYMVMYKVVSNSIASAANVRLLLSCFPLVAVGLCALLLLSETYYDFVREFRLTEDRSFVAILHTIGSSPGEKLRLGGFAPVNMAANILGICIFISIYIMTVSSWKTRLLLTAECLLMVYCMLKTGSKAGILSFVAGMGLLVLMVPKTRAHLIKLGVAGLLGLGVIIALFGKMLRRRFEAMASGDDAFITDRLDWWSKGFAGLGETGGWGLGTGGYPKIIDPVPAAHSFYFSVIFETGVVGAILMLVIVAYFVRQAVLAIPAARKTGTDTALYCLIAGLFIALLHGLVDFEITYSFFWIIAGLIAGIKRFSERQLAAEAHSS